MLAALPADDISLPGVSAGEKQRKRGGAADAAAKVDAETLLAQLGGVADMVGRFERRLLIRESELLKKEQEAQAESRRLEKLGWAVEALKGEEGEQLGIAAA